MKKPWETFSAVGELYEPELKRTVKEWVLLMQGLNKCDWYLKSGGCTMCGFNGPASAKEEYAWLTKYFGRSALDAMYWFGYFGIRHQRPERLTIYNGGNFLNSGLEVPGSKPEIPFSLQTAICRHVGRHPTIEKLFVETKASFITEKNIPILKECIGRKTLQVGIGFESVDDRVRDKLLKKGTTRFEFEKKVDILKKNGVRSFAYVFLKPVGLSEREAIDDAVNTIAYCFAKGIDEVSLSCAFIQEGTEMCEAYRIGAYKPPTLWSIIEVVKRTASLGPVRVGTFEDEPPPIDVPKNCPECTGTVNAALDRYRCSFDPAVFDGLDCPCR
ncbi:MAG: hypothetical protein KGH93_03395 [Patescibacteria group bacterium]|nr:hypothetical protein [Patescibacteria group bacterium]MDE1946210.1 hypothetical protein [Patescibacteria group bacterium]